MIGLFIFFIICILSMGYIVYEVSRYNEYIDRLAEQYTVEEIENKISFQKHLLETGHFKGEMFEEISDTLSLWEEVLKRKDEMKNDQYEDIVS